MEDEFTFYDFHSRSLASRRRTTRTSRTSRSSSCSLSVSECDPGECVFNCECAPEEDCKRLGIILGSVFGAVGLILIIVCVILIKTGKLKKMKTRTLKWAKSFKKSNKTASENELTPGYPSQSQNESKAGFTHNGGPDFLNNTNTITMQQDAYANSFRQPITTAEPYLIPQSQPMVYGTQPVFQQPHGNQSVFQQPQYGDTTYSANPVYFQPAPQAFQG